MLILLLLAISLLLFGVEQPLASSLGLHDDAGTSLTRDGNAVLASAEQSGPSLQERIDSASAGDTIMLPPGQYAGPLTISKPLRLEAEREGTAVLFNDTETTALHITADQVAVAGLQLKDEMVKQAPSVLVAGDGVVLEKLHIQTASYGIVLQDAADGTVRSNKIEWSDLKAAQAVPLARKGNGIDLFNTQRMQLTANTIQRMHDGIYVENSDDVQVAGNQIGSSRYGIHLMYTKSGDIRENTGESNITGAMIMASRDVQLVDNTFHKQNENVNSQGILLFDAHNVNMARNDVQGNRVGLYIEQSLNNTISANKLTGNFIGLQLLDAEQNRIHGNLFSGNVADAQAQNSANNDIAENFWDAFQGIDANGDGKSDIGYAVNPFFAGLIKKRPAFQLFFHSPGMVFLESLYQSDRTLWTKDYAPLMSPAGLPGTEKQSQSGTMTGLIGLILAGVSLLIIIMARRRT
ncbi:ABC transporter substrate-binding protein [Paenibacillaceae bacterium]|nr:ABC transporter substrate-binding protein [Paenibacillaceae bacterium]